MYFVKKINFNNNSQYANSVIVAHTTEKIASALELLETCARDTIYQMVGQESAENFKIIDILSMDQICQPVVDCVLVYRLENDPHNLIFYQRKTNAREIPGWWGNSMVTESDFRKIFNLELEEYDSIKNIESTTNTTNNGIFKYNKTTIPKMMFESPMIDLINELKQSNHFLDRLALTQNCIYDSTQEQDFD